MSEVNIIELVDLDEQPTVSNPLEHVVSCDLLSAKGEDTSKVHLCGNRGCGFNKDLYCSATGTECFGYMLTAI